VTGKRPDGAGTAYLLPLTLESLRPQISPEPPARLLITAIKPAKSNKFMGAARLTWQTRFCGVHVF